MIHRRDHGITSSRNMQVTKHRLCREMIHFLRAYSSLPPIAPKRFTNSYGPTQARSIGVHRPRFRFLPIHPQTITTIIIFLRFYVLLLPVVLLSTTNFAILAARFVVINLLPTVTQSLRIAVPRTNLLIALFTFAITTFNPFLATCFTHFRQHGLFVSILVVFNITGAITTFTPGV